MGPPALLFLRRKVCCGFLSPLKTIASAGCETANLGYSGKHTNHYNTEVTNNNSVKFIYVFNSIKNMKFRQAPKYNYNKDTTLQACAS
jgi:hypothetical protein